TGGSGAAALTTRGHARHLVSRQRLQCDGSTPALRAVCLRFARNVARGRENTRCVERCGRPNLAWCAGSWGPCPCLDRDVVPALKVSSQGYIRARSAAPIRPASWPSWATRTVAVGRWLRAVSMAWKL